jgi:hypothetical protein
LISAGYLTVVIASRKELYKFHPQSSLVSPLFAVFIPLRLGPLSSDSVRHLATLGGAVDFSDEELDIIVQTAEGHPYYVQLISSMLVDAKKAGQRSPDIQAIRQEVLERREQLRDLEDRK